MICLRVITDKAAEVLRKKYIESFVDCTLVYYTEYIQRLKEYSDGECYIGYLWDCLKNASTITESQAFEKLRGSTALLYIMWDIHSCEKIWIPNYWKYPKSAVIQISADELEKYLTTFPEDIYIFPSDYMWTVSLTHEYIGQERYCRYTCRG